MDFLAGFLTQVMSTAGVIFLFGWIIALLRRGFCNVAYRSGPRILLLTGIIGTPIHELSHALMCLIFGHKIEEIKLFDPEAEDGALGYVSHTYEKKNIYHQIGNFFIGVAPVLVGGLVVILLLAILLPEAFGVISANIAELTEPGLYPISDLFAFLWTSTTEIFSEKSLSDWPGVLFIILALMISTHMEMSGSDIKSGLRGLGFILVILWILNGLLYLIFPAAFFAVTEAFVSFGFALAAILSISALFLLLLLLVALLLRWIGSLF